MEYEYLSIHLGQDWEKPVTKQINIHSRGTPITEAVIFIPKVTAKSLVFTGHCVTCNFYAGYDYGRDAVRLGKNVVNILTRYNITRVVPHYYVGTPKVQGVGSVFSPFSSQEDLRIAVQNSRHRMALHIEH